VHICYLALLSGKHISEIGVFAKEARVKRDLDLVRDLLLKIEAADHKLSWKELVPANDNAQAEKILRHLQMMEEEAGLAKSIPVHIQGHRLPQDLELTWNGHDFLDAVRETTIWQKTKESAEATGSFTFELVKELAKGFIKTKIEEHTGVKL
jgi:hypothetical protein